MNNRALKKPNLVNHIDYLSRTANFNPYAKKYLLNNQNVKGAPEFYKFYPVLFQQYFNFSNASVLNDLSLAGYLYYQSILLADLMIDDKDFSMVSVMTILQEEAIKILTTVYDRNSVFWQLWNKRREEYYTAVKTEASFKEKTEILFNDYTDLADKKSAFGKVAIDCLWVLTQEKDVQVYNALLTSHKYFSTGFQLYDDVKDFKEDLTKGQFNYAVYRLQKIVDFKPYNHENLNKMLFIKGIGQEILVQAIDNFQKASKVLEKLQVSGKWQDTVKQMEQTIIRYLDITHGYIKTLERKIKLKSEPISHAFFDITNVRDKVIKNGLKFIKSDFEKNYSDLKHIMYLSKTEGFDNKGEIHVTDTFQRALLNDCFISISQKSGLDLSTFLSSECRYLIDKRTRDNIGGWSYFATVKEIAADIDDLGQMMQLFIRSKKEKFIDRYCKEAIRVALQDRLSVNGGIETWIIPKNNQTPIQKKQEFFNSSKWGKGPDLEVVATFVYALFLYDAFRYQGVIEKSLNYVLQQQHEKGFWKSRWYYGHFYGSFVCLRLLKKFKSNFQPQINRALKYILESQNNDGGFSSEKSSPSDPLSTAFAVLCLVPFCKKENPAIKRAKKYLLSQQNEDGSWDAVDFIKPKVSEPYKSKTITTGFVLKSMCENG